MKKAKSLLYINLMKALDKNNIPNNMLADKIGVSYATLSFKLSGISDFKLTEMLKIQKFINEYSAEQYSLDYLFKKE